MSINYRLFFIGLVLLPAMTGCSSSSVDATEDVVQTNTPPVLSGAPSTTVAVGVNYAYTPTSADPDGDSLTFDIQNKPVWATFSTSSGSLTGVPQASHVGVFSSIVISASDGQATTSMSQFTVTVESNSQPNNRPPVISGTPSSEGSVGSAYTFIPSASDPDGDTLIFNVSNLPSWLTFDASNGLIAGNPETKDIGTYNGITLTVSDGTETAQLPVFSITVSAQSPGNSPPMISGTPSTSVLTGKAYSFTPTASDPDGNLLAFSIQGKPTWATFSTFTGSLSGTPATSDVGVSSNIVVSVTDGEFSASLAPFSITVNNGSASNNSPLISGSPSMSILAGESYSFTPTASDPDNDPLTFSIINKPSWATFSTQTGALTGTPEAADVGTYFNIRITVNDGELSALLLPFNIAVEQVANGSITFTWTAPTENEDGSALLNLAGYRFFYGTAPSVYGSPMQVDNPGITTFSYQNLTPGTYYFAGKAINSAGVESTFSNEVMRVIEAN